VENGFTYLALYLSINQYSVRVAYASHWTFAQSFKDLNFDTHFSSLNGTFIRTIAETLQKLVTTLTRKTAHNSGLA
jgi:hypothetical protein